MFKTAKCDAREDGKTGRARGTCRRKWRRFLYKELLKQRQNKLQGVTTLFVSQLNKLCKAKIENRYKLVFQILKPLI